MYISISVVGVKGLSPGFRNPAFIIAKVFHQISPSTASQRLSMALLVFLGRLLFFVWLKSKKSKTKNSVRVRDELSTVVRIKWNKVFLNIKFGARCLISKPYMKYRFTLSENFT